MATRDLSVKPGTVPRRMTPVGQRVFPDGYNLDRESVALKHLIDAEEIDVNDPLYPRYQVYQDRLQNWALLQAQHQDRAGAEPDVPTEQARRAAQMSPLVSDNEDSMTLHTLEAMRLFLGATPAPGEFRYGVPGGRRAATALRQLFLLSAQDNPYADLALIEVDERIEEIKTKLSLLERQHTSLLAKARERGLNYSVLAARNPQMVSLGYRSPYGYSISNLIVGLDYTVRVIKSTERRDLTTKAVVYQQLKGVKHLCRSLFEACIHSSRILTNENMRSLSRTDWVPGADAAAGLRIAAAKQLLGTVPQDVFTGERSPRHSLRRERLSARDRKVLQQIALGLNVEEVRDPEAPVAEPPTEGLVD